MGRKLVFIVFALSLVFCGGCSIFHEDRHRTLTCLDDITDLYEFLNHNTLNSFDKQEPLKL